MSDLDDALRQLREAESESREKFERFRKESAERQAEIDRALARLKEMQDGRENSRTIRVNKRTHRIRFENETENEVSIVIEKKDMQ